MIKATIVASAIFLSTTLGTAAQQTPPPNPCATDDNFRSFDFWVGEWEVTPWAGGAIAGHNNIQVIENGCAVMENWTNSQGGTGRSINYYNPITEKWRQIWVSTGYSIDIEGGIKDGAMALEGEIHYYGNKTNLPMRAKWTPQEDGTVRQFFEQWNPQTETWDVWFDGKYTRQKAVANN